MKSARWVLGLRWWRRAGIGLVAFVAVTFAGLGLGVDQGFSASAPPTATTDPATSISQTSATLNGVTNPDGFTVTCTFNWGPTIAYGNSVPCSVLNPSGRAPVAVAAALSGLAPNTPYHFELVISYVGGPAVGADQTFTTLPNPPTVVTSPASGISQTAATVNATVNPNGGTVTECEFAWGPTTAYGSTVPCSSLPGSGTAAVAVAAALPGLAPNTTYHFVIVAANASGTNAGADQTFTTLPDPPTVVTGLASAISPTGATLTGTVNPNGGTVSACQFEWGPTTAYGNSIACSPSAGSGTSAVAEDAVLSGLVANTTYHFRVVATNPGGTSTGIDQTFRTGVSAPTVSASPPIVRSSSRAAFSGSVNPDGLPTTAKFEYGLDPRDRFGGGAVVYDQSTPVQQMGSDFSSHPVSASVSGLVPNALYHVRLVASNSAGTQRGPDQTFMTQKDPAPPAPVLGKMVNVKPVSGLVFIRPPRGKSLLAADVARHGLVKGRGFVPLTEARQLPNGSQIDARAGTLQVTTATNKRHVTQIATLAGALFSLSQSPARREKGLTVFALLEGDFPGAPSFRSCGTHAAPDGSGPGARAASVSPKVIQTLRARDHHGHFGTRGRNSSATVRGTVWGTIDRCDGTLTVVRRGTVRVFDFRRKVTITVHAGKRYLAKAR